MFTLSFWIGFYAWFADTEIATITDLPTAIVALQSDTNNKISIIEDWQDYEENLMLEYYNSKTTECNIAIERNNDDANYLMEYVQLYHNDQMTPELTEFLWMESELRSILDNAVSGSALSTYAGSVDTMVQEIDQLADDAKQLISTAEDVIENALVALCVGMGITASACAPTCGAVVGGACAASVAYAADAIDSALSAIEDKINEITDTAETPEISSGSSQRSNAVSSDNVDTGETYEETDNSAASEYASDTSNTQQTNVGEDFESVEGFDLSVYSIFFQFESIWAFVGFIDLLIIYRRLIYIIGRAIEFYKGKIKIENSELHVSSHKESEFSILVLKCKAFCGVFDGVSTFFKDIIPLILIGIGFYMVYQETEKFFEIDAITNLGIYNVFTSPVIAAQYRANVYLASKQDRYVIYNSYKYYI